MDNPSACAYFVASTKFSGKVFWQSIWQSTLLTFLVKQSSFFLINFYAVAWSIDTFPGVSAREYAYTVLALDLQFILNKSV